MYLSEIKQNSTVQFSEPTMMEYYGGIAEFLVRKVRHLEHQHFTMTQAFVWHAKSDSSLLLLNRLTRGEAEGNDVIAVFQQDHAGSVAELGSQHLDADHDKFAAEFKASYEEPGEEPYTTDYKLVASEEFHGIKDLDKKGPYLSQALYDSQDEETFYLALVEWEKDWLTVWYGMELRKDQITLL